MWKMLHSWNSDRTCGRVLQKLVRTETRESTTPNSVVSLETNFHKPTKIAPSIQIEDLFRYENSFHGRHRLLTIIDLPKLID